MNWGFPVISGFVQGFAVGCLNSVLRDFRIRV